MPQSFRATGEEAFRMGLVQRLIDGNVLEKTVEFAQHLVDNNSPTSMAVMKMQMWNHPKLGYEEATRQSINLMKTSISDPRNIDFKEGVASFTEKRNPSFAALDKKNPVIVLSDHYFGKGKL